MAGELFAFSPAYDHIYVIQHNLKVVLECSISLNIFTDSKQLFNVTTCAALTTEKRLKFEIIAAREAHYRN